MADPCQAAGYGAGPWGATPWGAGTFGPGDPLPVADPFDVFCVGPCAPMASIALFAGVTLASGSPSQIFIEGLTDDLALLSGGTEVDDVASLTVDVSVDGAYTLEWTQKMVDRPPLASDSHIFVGVIDESGYAAGLRFSDSGIGYGPSSAGPFEQLPGSAGLIPEGEYWTFRLVCNAALERVFIYATRTLDLETIGHQLRYVVPALLAADYAPGLSDRVVVSVKGTAADPAYLWLDSMCLSSAALISNIPPVADAGPDQALKLCTISRLDGSRSYDPEGAPLLYAWRLLDGPVESGFILQGADGATYPEGPPTGTTAKFYSELFNPAGSDVQVGDVIYLGGVPYEVALPPATDGGGHYVTITDDLLADNLSGATFHVALQAGLDAADTVTPAFFPDAIGVYTFDLQVSDGVLWSDPSRTSVLVAESVLPRGVVPDLSFIWDSFSDFWRLIEGKEVVETAATSLAQWLSTEMLQLWEADYNKSLRDIQRRVLRRWRNYDTRLDEPSRPASPRIIRSGLLSASIPAGGANENGNTLVLSDGRVVTFSGSNPLSAASLAQQIEEQLDVDVQVIEATDGTFRLRLHLGVSVSVDAASTAVSFTVGAADGELQGTGLRQGGTVYAVNQSLDGLGILDGDILVLDGQGYRIRRALTDPADLFTYMRLSLYDELPVDAPTTWSIPSRVTCTTSMYAGLVTDGDLATWDVLVEDEVVGTVLTTVRGAAASAPLELLFVHPPLDGYSAELSFVSRRSYIPVSPLVVDVPFLQEILQNCPEDQVLRRNLDFFLVSYRGTQALRFDTRIWEDEELIPERLWAEYTYIDNADVIDANFGTAVGLSRQDFVGLDLGDVDYLAAVQGLWSAFFSGASLKALRQGAQILLGLPFAETTGTILEHRTDYTARNGRFLVADLDNPAIVRSYAYPRGLPVETNPATGAAYVVGDTVQAFAPLVGGVSVVDRVKDPTWIVSYVEQGLLHEVDKFFRYIVAVDADVFRLSTLLFVQAFARRLRPLKAYPFFVVSKGVTEDAEIIVEDEEVQEGTLDLYVRPCNPLFFDQAGIADHPDPSPDVFHYRGQGDRDVDPSTPLLLYPAIDPSPYKADLNHLCPEDELAADGFMTSDGTNHTITPGDGFFPAIGEFIYEQPGDIPFQITVGNVGTLLPAGVFRRIYFLCPLAHPRGSTCRRRRASTSRSGLRYSATPRAHDVAGWWPSTSPCASRAT
jgi:hypothetical protein